jgi:hypothetical protein
MYCTLAALPVRLAWQRWLNRLMFSDASLRQYVVVTFTVAALTANPGAGKCLEFPLKELIIYLWPENLFVEPSYRVPDGHRSRIQNNPDWALSPILSGWHRWLIKSVNVSRAKE